MNWSKERMQQKELSEFLEDETPKEKKIKLAYDGVKLK